MKENILMIKERDLENYRPKTKFMKAFLKITDSTEKEHLSLINQIKSKENSQMIKLSLAKKLGKMEISTLGSSKIIK